DAGDVMPAPGAAADMSRGASLEDRWLFQSPQMFLNDESQTPTLLFDGFGQDMPNPPTGGGAMSADGGVEPLGAGMLAASDVPPITRAIDVPGASDTFVFTLTEAKKVYFDSLTDNNNIRWTLTGPDGTIVNSRGFGSSDSRDISGSNILDLAMGEYRLVVDALNDSTGVYSFRLLDIANATPFAVGIPVSAQNEGRRTDLYKFDVTAPGQRFFLDRDLLSAGDVTWRLI